MGKFWGCLLVLQKVSLNAAVSHHHLAGLNLRSA